MRSQKDSWQHSILNRELGHTSISSLAYLIAMNKYMQRVLEEEAKPVKGTFFFAPVTPETETNEEIAAKVPANEWPIMLKNTSLSLGKGVFRVKNKEKLFEILDEYRASKELQAAIKATNDGITDWFSEKDTQRLKAMGEFVPPFLFEHCVNLDDGWVEYCYEGQLPFLVIVAAKLSRCGRYGVRPLGRPRSELTFLVYVAAVSHRRPQCTFAR